MAFWDVFFEDGNINTIIGRPKMGKTNVVVDMADQAIAHGYTVLSNIIFFKPWNIEKAQKKGWLDKDIKYLDKPEGFKYTPLASELILQSALTEKNIIIIDEASVTASAYKSLSNTAVQMRYLGYNIRKIGGCFIIVAQTKGSVVPDLRKELINYEIHLVRKPDGSRSIDVLKRQEYFDNEKKEYDIEFLPYDQLDNVPPTVLPYCTRSTAGFIWDLNLYDIYYEITVKGYDAFEAREQLPKIVKNLVANKKVDDFMKQKKFMRTGTVAEFLKVHPNTIRNWADEGKLKCITSGQGSRLFSRSEVTKLAIEMKLI